LSTEIPGRAFISLLRNEAEARGLAGLLESLARPLVSASAVFLVPDVRGVDFFAAGGRRTGLHQWWAQHVPATTQPVYLLAHEDGLDGWVRDLDGVVLVAAAEGQAEAYPPASVVRADAETAPLALAEAVILRFSTPAERSGPHVGEADIFERRAALMVARVRRSAAEPDRAPTPPKDRGASRPQPASLRGRPLLPPLLDLGAGTTLARPTAPFPPDPLELLVAESARAERISPAWTADQPHSARPQPRPDNRRRVRLPRSIGWAKDAELRDARLAALMLARAPMLVVIGSRKGGVGKTSHAAGMAIVAGSALDTVGHRAAILDANVANPDAWGQLDLPANAATVRDLAAALVTGTDPPPPVHSVTPALACYPERRDGVEYTRTDIHRLARHLRSRYTFAVVDMSNRLPDPMAGPEAAAAAFWLEEADALILPTASSRQDFNGVLDYLDVDGRPPTLVPCIVSPVRRNRRHPMAVQYLEAIAARVDAVIEIPDEADSVRRAGMDGVPVQDVSPKMRAAYRGLTEAVVRLPPRVR
jgi:hypothetical protein